MLTFITIAKLLNNEWVLICRNVAKEGGNKLYKRARKPGDATTHIYILKG